MRKLGCEHDADAGLVEQVGSPGAHDVSDRWLVVARLDLRRRDALRMGPTSVPQEPFHVSCEASAETR